MPAPQPTSPGKKPVFHKIATNLYRLESSRVYYALIKRHGKQIRRSLKTADPKLAQRRLGDLRTKVSRLNRTKGASLVTFGELARRWLDAQRAALKEKSVSRLEVCLKGIQPHLGHLPVRNVTARDCEEWLTKRGRAISASSYKHERRTLLRILDYAVRDGLVLENVARGALPTRKIGRSKLVIPTRDQFRLLVETLRSADVRAQHGADLVELLACSGMRLAEALSLAWEDIDGQRGTFTVTGGERGTKNHEVRVVPLFPALRELLERIRGGRQPGPAQRVVPITGPNGAATAIKSACRKAGLPRFLHHSLRHYFCSNAIEAGIDFGVIAGWLGHKDGGYLVSKTYGHLRDAHSFEMARRMTFSAVEAAPAIIAPGPQAQTA